MSSAATSGVVAGLASLALCGAALATASDGFGRADSATRISISSRVPAFHGMVRSRDESCERRRRVVLYRKTGPGDAKRLGSDRSNASGRWVVRPETIKSGAYYAKVKPGSGCRAARSDVVIVD